MGKNCLWTVKAGRIVFFNSNAGSCLLFFLYSARWYDGNTKELITWLLLIYLFAFFFFVTSMLKTVFLGHDFTVNFFKRCRVWPLFLPLTLNSSYTGFRRGLKMHCLTSGLGSRKGMHVSLRLVCYLNVLAQV